MDISSFLIGWILGLFSAAIYSGRQRRDTKHRKTWEKIRRSGPKEPGASQR
jgi:hypothetical protein